MQHNLAFIGTYMVYIRALIKGFHPYHLLRLSMLDWPLKLRVKLPFIVTGVENKATGDSKLNDSPLMYILKYCFLCMFCHSPHQKCL